MKQTLVAKRYAKALFDLASEMNIIKEVAIDMQLVKDVCLENRELRALLGNPCVKPGKKVNILRVLFAEKIQELSAKFLDIIIRKSRAAIIQVIADEFGNLFLDYQEILPVQVKTAIPLDDQTRNHLLELLNRKLEKNIQLHESVDAEIIGGLVLHVDDLRLDASLRYKLSSLRQEMKDSLVV
ncbi:MAG: ATP synthase F1 subunit delta [Bacteroidales bacterium]